MTRKNKGKLVFSTRTDADLEAKSKQEGKRQTSLPPQQQTIRVSLDRKGRRGKTVTVAVGFHLTAADLKTLEKALKQHCGAGGTSKDDTIEIQGENREKVIQYLSNLNYKVKAAGG